MTLSRIRAAYLAGTLPKAEYIERMHEEHVRLFQYADYLAQTELERIEITDGQVIATARHTGIRMICNQTDRRIAPWEIINFLQYEHDDEAMLYRLAPAGATVLDIGANIGWYALNLAMRIPDARVYAFEPIPHTYEQLQCNLRENDARNIVTFPIGLAEEEKELVFFYNPEGSGAASARNISGTDAAERLTCRVTTLDAFVREQQLQVDLIKCDVEGGELFVFQGGRETLATQRPIVFTEMLRKWAAKFGYHPNDILAYFGELGYGAYVVEADRLLPIAEVDDSTVATNYFFLHQETHTALIAANQGEG